MRHIILSISLSQTLSMTHSHSLKHYFLNYISIKLFANGVFYYFGKLKSYESDINLSFLTKRSFKVFK